jgi:hypothetical protein
MSATRQQGHSSSTLQAYAGITDEQMAYWRRHGWIKPTEETDFGSGTAFRWSRNTVHKAMLMGRLVRAGFPSSRAHEVAEAYLAQMLIPGAFPYIDIGDGIYLRFDPIQQKESVFP